MYLATVQMAVLDSRGHIALARDVHALGEGVDHRRPVLLVLLVQDADDGLELGRGHLTFNNLLEKWHDSFF
jgi:hypothetical protein